MYFVAKPIVTNGLVLNLDAGNTLSYTSGSSNWNDLLGSTTLTTVNNPPFSADNGGYVNFTSTRYAYASSSIMPSSVNINGSDFTLDCWIRFNSVGTSQYIAATYNFQGSAGSNEKGWYFRLSNTAYLQFNVTTGSNNVAITSTNQLSANRWVHAVITGVSNSFSLYENGVFVTSSLGTLNENQNNGRTFSFGALISNDGNTVGPSGNVQIGSFKFYKAALTPLEVQQNFNALKGRYGL